jgi:integrase
MDDGTTYNVRVYRTEVYKGTRVTTYKVRWKTDHRSWKEGFRNTALADSFRSSLLTAARKGEAFSLSTGRPVSWDRDESALTWYALTLDYVALLSQHLKNYPPGPDGRVFTGPRGGIFNDRAYLKIFHKARTAAFTPSESASLLARRPYDLRHAAVSTWLNAGVPAPQVAEWAGHSVDVLLRVYAKCISGQQAEAKRRVEEATRPRDDE